MQGILDVNILIVFVSGIYPNKIKKCVMTIGDGLCTPGITSRSDNAKQILNRIFFDQNHMILTATLRT